MAARLRLLGVLVAVAAGAAAAAAARRAHAAEMARLDAVALTSDVPAARARAAAYARAMRAPYDPLMGTHGDPLRRYGFVVCVDVPIRAYRGAGVSLTRLLSGAARAHPGWFALGPDNPADGPFFSRRVRNYWDLFKHHPALEASAVPQAGDLAFYGRWHVGLVTEAAADGSYKVVEASGPSVLTREYSGAVLARRWGPPAFFGRLRAPPCIMDLRAP